MELLSSLLRVPRARRSSWLPLSFAELPELFMVVFWAFSRSDRAQKSGVWPMPPCF